MLIEIKTPYGINVFDLNAENAASLIQKAFELAENQRQMVREPIVKVKVGGNVSGAYTTKEVLDGMEKAIADLFGHCYKESK